jgi:uncharacterized membrane protein
MFVSIIFLCKWFYMCIETTLLWTLFRSPYQRRKRSIEAKTHNNNKTQHNKKKSSLARLSFFPTKKIIFIIIMPSAFFLFMYLLFFLLLFLCHILVFIMFPFESFSLPHNFFLLRLLLSVTFNFVFNYNFSLDVSLCWFFSRLPLFFLFIS